MGFGKNGFGNSSGFSNSSGFGNSSGFSYSGDSGGIVIPTPLLWYDPDLSTVTTSGSGSEGPYVVEWEDLGTASHNVTAAGTVTPQLASSIFGSHSALYFDGFNDVIHRPTSTVPDPTGGCSIAVWMQSTSAAAVQIICEHRGDPFSVGRSFLFQSAGGGGFTRFMLRNSGDSSWQIAETGNDERDGNPHLLQAYFDPANNEIGVRADNDSWTTAAATSSRSGEGWFIGDGLILGAGFPYEDYIGSVRFWDSFIGTDVFDQIWSNENASWGV